ncbi:hypothetical protein GCM10027081_05900 [Cupriavidus yeoncheonensis]
MVPRTCSPCELRKLTTGSICVLEYTVCAREIREKLEAIRPDGPDGQVQHRRGNRVAETATGMGMYSECSCRVRECLLEAWAPGAGAPVSCLDLGENLIQDNLLRVIVLWQQRPIQPSA